MGIQRFDHVAINARDIAKSKTFYSEILGLAVDKIVDMGDCILHYVRLPDGSAIELFEHKDRTVYDKLHKTDGLVRHLAFLVDNIEEINQKLLENNIEFELDLCVLDLCRSKRYCALIRTGLL